LDPEKWQRVKALFQAALEKAPTDRDAFLAQASAGDNAVRAEVESLLASHQNADSFVGMLREPSVATPVLTAQDSWLGRLVGSYRIIRQIGRGGMASVYLGVRADEQYRKHVAIKLVMPGLDNDEVVQRFRNERQTLAALDHPNIVKLLDGGSTQDGWPYLVMDYVEGMQITEFCDGRRLSITDRLELFRLVCEAVHYAHQNLVIHRDLKPGNILVTAKGVPKLLDFGIAKLLNPEFAAHTLLMTRADRRLMTPEYASPEQVRGEPVTTATDVYSLGVVLYELLTGHRPYRLKEQTLHEIERAICIEEPEKPSTVVTRVAGVVSLEGTTQTGLTPELVSQTREGRPEKLRRRLVGDLDNIVLMALRKEPQRRYPSVEHLSQDILRHLEGLPVTARPATLRYRASKFIARHTAAVSAAAVALLMLIVGIIFTTREAKIAKAEKARAERRFNDVRNLANSFLFEFHDSIKDLPGATPARKLVVRKAQEYLDGLAKEAAGDASLQAELAEAYLRVGDVQGNPYSGNLGDRPGALESYRKALAIAGKLVHDDPKSLIGQRLVARSQKAIGEVLANSGEAPAAIDNFRKAISGLETVVRAQPTDAKLSLELADSYGSLGEALDSPSQLSLGDKGGALENYQKSLAIYQRLAGAEPNNPRVLSGLAIAETEIGDSREDSGALTEALGWFGKAFKTYEGLSDSEPVNSRYRKNLTSILDRMALVRGDAGDKVGAIRDMRKSLELYEALSTADPQNMNLREGLWLRYTHLGESLSEIGDATGAVQNFRRALVLIQDLAQRNPDNFQLQAKLSDSLLDLGFFLVRKGDVGEGSPMILRGLHISKSLADRPEATAGDLSRYAEALLSCKPGGPCDSTGALPYAKRAVDVTKGSNPAYLDSLARTYFKTGDSAKAVEAEQKVFLLLPPSDTEKVASAKRKEYEANLARFQRALRKQGR
jgi:serine/threonine protein kinase/tetratricopeptide (TPR) repeat protein